MVEVVENISKNILQLIKDNYIKEILNQLNMINF